MPIDALPHDAFGVHVGNDAARACLLWLANQIGEAQLRTSVANYNARWPGYRPLVSTLLGWYRLLPPREVYCPVPVPVYWLYVLCRRDAATVKIGMTRHWPSRALALALPHRAVADAFDLDRSRAFLVGPNKAEVLRREGEIKRLFAKWRVDAQSREWFDGAVTNDVLVLAASFDHDNDQVMVTLRDALDIRASGG